MAEIPSAIAGSSHTGVSKLSQCNIANTALVQVECYRQAPPKLFAAALARLRDSGSIEFAEACALNAGAQRATCGPPPRPK
jgi:hypothetical protein